MSCISGLLGQVGTEVEAQLRPVLGGLTGFLVSGYLPQSWVFATETEVVTFHVDSRGHASVVEGRAQNPDVSIETSHAMLSAALRTRNASSVPKGPLNIIPHTSKGKAAFQFLRGKLGL